MGCGNSTTLPHVLRTTLLKTNHPSLNTVIEDAEKSLRELARICNPLEVAIDRFFTLCGRSSDDGFRICLLSLLIACIANCGADDFILTAETPGAKVTLSAENERLIVEFEAWRQLSMELQYVINDLSESLLKLMDCASTSHKLNQTLVVLVKTEELRVVDIRKVMMILEKNEEVIKTGAELLHLNIRRAKQYSTEAAGVMQWMRTREGWSLLSQEAENSRKLGVKSTEEVLQLRAASVQEISSHCESYSVETNRN